MLATTDLNLVNAPFCPQAFTRWNPTLRETPVSGKLSQVAYLSQGRGIVRLESWSLRNSIRWVIPQYQPPKMWANHACHGIGRFLWEYSWCLHCCLHSPSGREELWNILEGSFGNCLKLPIANWHIKRWTFVINFFLCEISNLYRHCHFYLLTI